MYYQKRHQKQLFMFEFLVCYLHSPEVFFYLLNINFDKVTTVLIALTPYFYYYLLQ